MCIVWVLRSGVLVRNSTYYGLCHSISEKRESMALSTCPQCKRPVAKNADVCPGCAANFKKERQAAYGAAGCVGCFTFLLLVVGLSFLNKALPLPEWLSWPVGLVLCIVPIYLAARIYQKAKGFPR